MNRLEQNIISLYGDKGKQWLTCLTHIVKDRALRWNIESLKPFKNLSYNYVLSGFRKKQPVVLKLSPDEDKLRKEAAALKIFAGHGVIKVLEEADGALLLEQAIPGTSLKSYFPNRDDEAVEIVGDIMKKLYQSPLPKEGQFSTIRHWLGALDAGEGVPPLYLEKARPLRDKLLKTTAEFKLLHGDLHHYNILANGKDWIVIDPQGVIGEPAYEVALFIRNPIPDLLDSSQAMSIINHRVHMFAHILQIDEDRIHQWCFVQAVLAWIWALKDGLDPSYFERLTAILEKEQRPS